MVDRDLRLGSSLVYPNNMVTSALPKSEHFTSGLPVVTGDGSLVGLFYHRSDDGEYSGFVELDGLPRPLTG